jgi:hypothetical protein
MARKKQKPESTVTRSHAVQAASVQSGDLQGLPDEPGADSESVRELVEEGQAFEAAVISGIENVPPADAAEVRTKEVPADDVPDEYIDQDPDEPKE